MKKFFVLSLLCGIILVGCVSKNEKKIDSESSLTTEKNSQQKNIDNAISSLKKGFSAYHDVSFDKKTKSFILSPKEGLSETKTLIKIADNPTEPKYEETLKGIASNFIELSISISKNIGKDYKIKLASPGNDHKYMFVVQDGNISYPIITEFKDKKSSSNTKTGGSTKSGSQQNVEAENARLKAEEEASEAAIQAQFEEEQRKADELNAQLQAQADADNARFKAEEEASKADMQAQFEEDQRKADEFNAKLQADWEAENRRLAEQDKANGY
ncbi:hypothetical protein [Enterococcus sp. AZ177]|uniref:hypothetical protein n=1 Tax=unclassified Enterococcus TaxID=2608891 RepID=UPI003D300733